MIIVTQSAWDWISGDEANLKQEVRVFKICMNVGKIEETKQMCRAGAWTPSAAHMSTEMTSDVNITAERNDGAPRKCTARDTGHVTEPGRSASKG